MSVPTAPPGAHPAPHRRGPASILAVLGLLVIAAIVIYLFMIRDRETPTIKLALVTWTQDPFWEPVLRGAQDCAQTSNIDLAIVQAKPTVDDQNQRIRELLGTGIVGIAISPNDAAAQAAILNDAAGQMPVVTFDTDAPETKRKRFVGIDNYAAGHMAADELREALPDGGPVLITVGSATMLHGRDRRQGVIDGLLERGFDRARAADAIDAPLKGSKFTIVATVTDAADPAKATALIAEALKTHPEVKGIIGLFSYSAPAALEAMKQVGKAGQIQVVGFDDSDQTQAALQTGQIHSSVLQDTYRAGYESIRVLADEARGIARGPAEQSPIVNVRINVLTADNLNEMRETGSIRTPSNATPTKPAG